MKIWQKPRYSVGRAISVEHTVWGTAQSAVQVVTQKSATAYSPCLERLFSLPSTVVTQVSLSARLLNSSANAKLGMRIPRLDVSLWCGNTASPPRSGTWTFELLKEVQSRWDFRRYCVGMLCQLKLIAACMPSSLCRNSFHSSITESHRQWRIYWTD